MKLLMLCYEYPPIGGGGAKVVDGLTSELSKLGQNVDLITMGYKNLPAYEVKGFLNIHRVKCIRLRASICSPAEMISYLVSALLYLIKYDNNDYYLNHTHFIFPDGVLAYLLKKIRKIPYLITAHGSDVPGYNPDRFKVLHKLLKPLWQVILKNAETVIVPSDSLDQMIKQIMPGINTCNIPNGINLKKYSPAAPRKNKILVVTRMFERKGVQHFINALSDLDHHYEVNIVGEGPYLDILKKLAASESRIHFRGFLDNNSKELSELYETSRIFVFTSEAENFPIVLLEAMIAGLAIITSSNNGCAEVVGDGALLVNPRDPKEIRKALIKLMLNPDLCNQLGSAARKRAETLFGWKTVARKYLTLYKNTGLNSHIPMIIPAKVK